MPSDALERVVDEWASEWSSRFAAVWLVMALLAAIQAAIVEFEHCQLGCTGAYASIRTGLDLVTYLAAANVIALPELLSASASEAQRQLDERGVVG